LAAGDGSEPGRSSGAEQERQRTGDGGVAAHLTNVFLMQGPANPPGGAGPHCRQTSHQLEYFRACLRLARIESAVADCATPPPHASRKAIPSAAPSGLLVVHATGRRLQSRSAAFAVIVHLPLVAEVMRASRAVAGMIPRQRALRRSNADRSGGVPPAQRNDPRLRSHREGQDALARALDDQRGSLMHNPRLCRRAGG
jgi:hypothetical protein